jgi:uncharacterized protein (TIGR00369 family)
MNMTSDPTPDVLLDTETVTRLIDEAFPEIQASGRPLVIEAVAPRSARVRLPFHPHNLRPGGTVSGPAMFTLADFTIYVAVIATLGKAGIPAVTSNLSINFLLRPDPGDLVAEARLIRVGRRLIYAEVALHADGRDDIIAHATSSYAVPSGPKV